MTWDGRALLHAPDPTPEQERRCHRCWLSHPAADFRSPRGRVCRACYRARIRREQQARRVKARAEGICPQCQRRPAEAGSRYCQPCAAAHRIHAARVRRKRESRRLCLSCHNRLLPSWTRRRCSRCLAESVTGKRIVNAAYRAAGLCYVCADHPPVVPGRKFCPRCLEKARLKERARRERRNRC